MDFDAVAYLKNALGQSEFIKDIRNGFQKKGYSPVSGTDTEILEKQGNICSDWSRVFLKEGASIERITRNIFSGEVYIGCVKGIYDCRLENVYAEDGAELYRSTVSDSIIRENACIRECAEISCTPESVFGNGTEMSIAIETGGREVRMFAEMNVETAERIAGKRHDEEYLKEYGKHIEDYLNAVTSDRSIIGKDAEIINTTIRSTYIGESARIDNARLVENVTVLSNVEERSEISHGAFIRNSIVQWGCTVTSFAVVESSCLTEHSHAERHGKITETVLGPNTGVAEGEVTASLLGPFVGFHHQSLLIAALWPEGKGNVAHGANIGSNHPSRAPDQEIWPGEGCFIGLDTHIKFPSNFRNAPYILIAAGVLALAQRIDFPFSLINVPAHTFEHISPAFNEISPAWVLSDDMFMITRNEAKYKKRNKARRSTFDFEVFRPHIIDLCIEARNRLAAAGGMDVYTGTDIDGLGKNYMFEKSRVKGVDTYTFFIRYYALKGLLKRLHEQGVSADILSAKDNNSRWEHERTMLKNEFDAEMSVGEMLEILASSQEKIAESVQASKEKDDIRGRRIIPDYAYAHTSAEDDDVVRKTWQDTEELLRQIEEIKKKL